MAKKKRRNQFTIKERLQAMEDFLACYEKALGVLTPAAAAAGVDRSTVWRWRKEYPEFDERCNEIEDVAIDFAETKLYNLINTGDTAATIFYLKTKGRRRGYTEKIQHEVDQAQKGITINVANPESAQVLQDIINRDEEQCK
mgnify:CR=1 FL=1